MAEIDLEQAEKLAIRLAKKAGHMLLDSIDKAQITEMKDKEDFCTDLDLAVEKLIIDGIKKHYPDHHIHSEEIGDIEGSEDYHWVIDPIDGTKHFMKNIPLFAVSIALAYKKDIVLGVVFNPATHHLYHAHKGGGAWLNNNPIKVSETKLIDHAFVYLDITKIHDLPKKEIREALKRLHTLITETYRIRALGVGSLGMCYLAQGAYDAYFDLTGQVKFVDIAAGSLIVTEAGGIVSDLEGKPINHKTKHYLAINSKLKKKVKDLLQI